MPVASIRCGAPSTSWASITTSRARSTSTCTRARPSDRHPSIPISRSSLDSTISGFTTTLAGAASSSSSSR